MPTLEVSLGDRSYPILIRHGLLEEAGEQIARHCRGRRAAVVSHPRLLELYAGRLHQGLSAQGFEVGWIPIAPGERRKSLYSLRLVLDDLLQCRLDRSSLVIAFGGGVIGDLAGLAASLYMRGIDLVQIPTTLLSCVDSSVGGKTAVNLPAAKNVVGTFYQPRLVLMDPALLSSLPKREIRAGVAEVVKYGAIWDAAFFRYLGDCLPELLSLDPGVTEQCLLRSCQIKAEIVSKDERDLGLRAILNYGHTLGHALESVAGYGTYRHGEAVSVGMVAAARLSESLGVAQEPVSEPLSEMLRAAGLPVGFRKPLDPVCLMKAMGADKKAAAGKLNFVLARRIGEVEVRPLDGPRALEGVLSQMLAEAAS
ncbi:MAG TPA: 3-dehydroquinate synthase [Armatimonadota bacterium]